MRTPCAHHAHTLRTPCAHPAHSSTRLLLHTERKQKLTLPLWVVSALRVGPRLHPAPSQAPWLHLGIETTSDGELELIAPDADVLYSLLRGLAALVPAEARPRLGELAWVRARLIVTTLAERQGLTYVQAWTQIIVEAAASAATFTPSRMALSLSHDRGGSSPARMGVASPKRSLKGRSRK